MLLFWAIFTREFYHIFHAYLMYAFFCCRIYEAVWDLAHGNLDMDGTFPDRHADLSGVNI